MESYKIPDKLLKDVLLALPPEARAAIAAKLLDSLDVEVDEDVEAAWRKEIERRVLDVDTGSVSPIVGRKYASHYCVTDAAAR